MFDAEQLLPLIVSQVLLNVFDTPFTVTFVLLILTV